jgi:rhodanese-related sulfurtransferase
MSSRILNESPDSAPAHDAARAQQDGVGQIIDVREVDEHRREHIAGATLFPTSAFVASSFPQAATGRTYFVLCRSGGRAAGVVEQLRAIGRSDVFAIEGGLKGWKAASLPTVRDSSAPMPIMRQVMIAAGSLVAGFTALGAWVSPSWLIGAGFVGCGLAFAGLSGICPMAKLMARMPWNSVKRRPVQTPVPSAASPSAKCGTGCCGR